MFLFGAESLTKNPFRIDQAIFSSYFIIPPLIFIAHLVERNKSMGGFIIGCIELTCVKFAATYVIATAFWINAGEPPPLPEFQAPPPKPKFPIVPTKIPEATTGTIYGTVSHADGTPATQALVYIGKGLEEFVFEVPSTTVAIHHNGQNFFPPLTVVQTHQALYAHSHDGQLHTFLDSYPVLPQEIRDRSKLNSEPVIRIENPLGIVTLRCGVHPNEKIQTPAHIAVFAHPFATFSDADGHFIFNRVPATTVEVLAWTPNTAAREAKVKIVAQRKASVSLKLETP